jgi:hypothetical protein
MHSVSHTNLLKTKDKEQVTLYSREICLTNTWRQRFHTFFNNFTTTLHSRCCFALKSIAYIERQISAMDFNKSSVMHDSTLSAFKQRNILISNNNTAQ